MSSLPRQLTFNLFIYPAGHHEAAWRYKLSQPEHVLDIAFYQRLAQQAEAAKLDAVFFADGPSLAREVVDIIDREKPTIRQLIQHLAGARGHWVVSGTPASIADTIETWFTTGAADGFNVTPPYLPGCFDIFADEVIPILRRRGLFREEYTGSTLRDHYGLPRPESGYTRERRRSA